MAVISLFLALSAVCLLSSSVDAATRVYEDKNTDCQFIELKTFFGADTKFALPPDLCYSFFIGSGDTLIPSAIKATCGADGKSVIIEDFSSADCSADSLIESYTIKRNNGEATLWSASLGGLPATLKNFNCASENRDCYLISDQQYFDGPCDPLGVMDSNRIAVGTIPQINGYCYANPLAGLSQVADCDNFEIRFFDNLNCDDKKGVLFTNTFKEYADCLAQGPSANNGGFNESSTWRCTPINDSSDDDDNDDSDDGDDGDDDGDSGDEDDY